MTSLESTSQNPDTEEILREGLLTSAQGMQQLMEGGYLIS
eukprot:CAMPEP_0114584336 /NCGR_PEP_ID=MMETSP0125-20121206/8048_1 /TAXON_ID=485358 ORGANISM="Aristerostoma sp., Strain ATCC 50986" /NCGR_SAMPLE_ID=MMETSP0125 /ASSEMBLY_ACC=CAM_ASM_000245 /LENGTH=39 /DNA_ID= /DNA_START= /DNA_END= /DNA_ORIENTATION=